MLKLKNLILTLYLKVVYLSNSCFYTQFFTIFQGQSSIKNWATQPGYSYSLVWADPQFSILSHSYTLVGLRIDSPNKVLSYSSSLQLVTQSSSIFYYNPTQNISEIVYVQFAVILLKSCGIPFHIGLIDLPLKILNMPNRTVDSQTFANLSFSNPITTGVHLIRVYLSSVSLSSFINFHFDTAVFAFQATTFTLRITSAAVCGCIFKQMKVAYMFLAKSLTLQYDFIFVTYSVHQNNLMFNIPKSFFPNASNKCFIGLYYIYFFNITAGASHITVTLSNDIIGPTLYTTSTNLSNIIYSNTMTCLSRCSTTQFPDYLIGDGICSPCLKLMASCLICNSSGHCLTCFAGYYFLNTPTSKNCVNCFNQCLECYATNTCWICNQNRLVKGGCSIDPGCIQVDSTLTYLDNSCISCKIEYNLVLINGTCKCKPGYSEVNDLCMLNSVGCASAIMKNSTVLCFLCSQNLEFKLYPVNGICVCKNGYKVKDESCIQVCGDGIRSKHQCDDGNAISGDGCSSDCRIQVNFDCFGNNSSPSVCIYLRKNIKLELISISKIHFENIGVFKLKITPGIAISNKINASSIIFSINRSYSSLSIIIDKNEISILVEYSENLQGFPATVQLRLENSYFLQSETSISFNMTSGNSKLIVAQNHQKLTLYAVIFEGISWAMLVLFVFSVIVHKMIGLELLQSLQIIYFVHLTNQNYTNPFSVFMFLTNLGYNFLFHSNMSSNIDSTKSKVEFNPQNYTFSQNILIESVLIPAAILGIFLLSSYVNQPQRQISSDQAMNNTKIEEKGRSFTYFIYNRILFPLSIGSMFLFFLVLGTNSKNDNSSVVIKYAIIFLTIILSKVYFIQLKSLLACPNQQMFSERPKCDGRYIGFYLIFQLIVSIILTSSFIIKQITPEYCLTPLYFILIILMLVYRPYKNWFHNLGAILGVITTFSFLIWCTIRNNYPEALIQEEEIFAIFLILLLIILSFVSSFLRLVMELNSMIGEGSVKKHQKIIDQSQESQQLQQCKQSFQIKQINNQEFNWKYQKIFLMKDKEQNNQILINIPQEYFVGDPKISDDFAKFLQHKKIISYKLAKEYKTINS